MHSSLSSQALTVVSLLLAPALAAAQQADFGTELFKKESWTVRLDASADPKGTTLQVIGTDVHLESKAAALAWRPRDRATGNFVVRATVVVPSGSTGGAGLFFGGFDLEGMDRNWAACMVRSDGTWSIPHRNGVELHNFKPWNRDAVVSAEAREGHVANLVEWVVSSERVECRINGKELYSFSRPRGIVPGGLRTIEGDVGLRVDAGASARFASFEIVKTP